ncbi:MAG TPA: IPT/TIG domain-containing protein [Bryobacteraceae bacterium]|nr:IPT/TIG domain-containing protein [Bryobacteraceae bacterium]
MKQALKRSIGNWQLYAAVSGSALAMATGASASLISNGVRPAPEHIASVRFSRQLASSNDPPFLNAVKVALARQDAARATFRDARAGVGDVSLASAPSISPGGVVPIFGVRSVVEPGEWISIYGSNLASQTAHWNGDFPTSLGGVTVTINGKRAYLSYVSATQINVQAPDDTATGTVPVVVTTPAGTATSTVNLSQFSPSFSLLYQELVAGIILRADGSGAYGGGTYDILGPDGNTLGYPTVAAQPGDLVELFGVGFGPTTPAVPAGKAFTGAAPTKNEVSLYINNIAVKPSFVGLSSAGLYQINLIVPVGLGAGAVPVQASVGGMQTQGGVLFPLANPLPLTTTGGSSSSFGGPGFFGSFVGGSGGGGSAGFGGGSAALRKSPYQPKLQFAPETKNG